MQRNAEDILLSDDSSEDMSSSEDRSSPKDGFPASFDGFLNEQFYSESGEAAGNFPGLFPPLWQSPVVKGRPPMAAEGRSADVIGRNKVYVFGGCYQEPYECIAINDLHVLETDKMVWRKLCLPNTPSKRYDHATAVVGLQLFVYGGDNGNKCLDDLHVLDTLTLTWSEFTATGTRLSPRDYHTMNHVNGKLYLFGWDWEGRNCFNAVDVLDLATQSWNRPKISGSIPERRYNYTMTVMNTSLILVGGNDRRFNDIHLFDTVALTWTQPEISGDLPHAWRVYGHSATLIGGRLFLFGGNGRCSSGWDLTNQLYILDTSCFELSNPQLSWKSSDGEKRCNDLHFLDVERLTGDSFVYESIRSLLWSLKALVGNPQFCDVTLVVDGRDIPAYRGILATRCFYFRSMFSGPWKESKQERIVIHGWRYEPYMVLLEFLYTGCLCKAQASIICDVVGLADMYDLDRLKALCENNLKNSVDSENVRLVLKHAEMYQSVDLTIFCRNYIVSHEMEIPQTEESEGLSYLPMERHREGETLRQAEDVPFSRSLTRNRSSSEGGSVVSFDSSSNAQLYCRSARTAEEPFNLIPPWWQQLHVKGQQVLGRFRTAVLIGRDKLYVFGGLDDEGYEANDLYVLEMEAMVWRKLSLPNTPSKRHNHATAVVGLRLFVHGGCNRSEYFDNLHVLDTLTLTWTKVVATGTRPSKRYRHSMNHVNNGLYVFGGWDGHDNSAACFPKTMSILRLATGSWIQPKISGKLPQGRGDHTMTTVNRALLLIGGIGENCKTLDDIHLFNTLTLTWTQPDVFGTGPCMGLYGHSATLIGDRLFVYGGCNEFKPSNELYVLDTKSFEWSNPQDVGRGPEFIYYQSSFLVGRTGLFFFGATVEAPKFNDLHFLDVGRLTGDKLLYGSIRVLLRELKMLVNASEFFDATLVVDERDIRVHRCILVAQCHYFRMMFSGSWKESKQERIAIYGWMHEPYMALLEFLYTGCLSKAQAPIICDVMGLADMYGLDRLKALCENRLKNSLDSENVLYILKHAEMYQSADLTIFCRNYILSHKVDIAETEESEGLSDLPMERHREGETVRCAGDVPSLTRNRSSYEDGFPASADGSPNGRLNKRRRS